MHKSVFMQTYGWPMKEWDSEEVLGMLMARGYEVVEAPEGAQGA